MEQRYHNAKLLFFFVISLSWISFRNRREGRGEIGFGKAKILLCNKRHRYFNFMFWNKDFFAKQNIEFDCF